MTLVQLLRHNEDVTPEQGLFAESLAYASLQGGVGVRAGAGRLRPGPNSRCSEPASAVVVERSGDESAHHAESAPARNAYSTAMRDGLYEALQLLRMDAAPAAGGDQGRGQLFLHRR